MQCEDPDPVLHDTALLAASLQAPGQARAHVDQACAGWANALTDTAKLLVSELVTNALIHGEGDIELRIFRNARVLRVEVGDACAAWAVPALCHNLENEHGRGLLIVSTLATSWGSAPGAAAGTKMVWFEVIRPEGS